MSRRLGSSAALVATLVVGLLFALALTSISAEVYEAVTDGGGVAELDHPILDAAITLRSPFLDAALTDYTNIAGVVGIPVLALSAVIGLGVRRRSWTPVILIVSAAIGSLLMTIVGKQLIGRQRPPLQDAVPPFEYSASFPSGHTLNAVVVAGVVAYLLVLRQRTRRARAITIALAAAFAFTVGLSRVYLGHHWFTDVVVAWTVGVAWLALVITAHRLYLTVTRSTVTTFATGYGWSGSCQQVSAWS